MHNLYNTCPKLETRQTSSSKLAVTGILSVEVKLNHISNPLNMRTTKLHVSVTVNANTKNQLDSFHKDLIK